MEWCRPNVIINALIHLKLWGGKKSLTNRVCVIYRCSLRVEPADNVCQLRIDLLDFSLAPPNGDGICNTDVISITGATTSVPSLCGENSGQHLIVYFAGTNPINIAIKTTSSYTFGRHWNLRIAQINCDSEYRGKHFFLMCHLKHILIS